MGSASSQTMSRFDLTAQRIIDECQHEIVLSKFHVLVTGATSGIGFETARVLACNGATVYAIGRTPDKVEQVVNQIRQQILERSSNGSVLGFICDLNSFSSIKQFADQFIKEDYPLNILILNAGILNIRFSQTRDGLEQVMGVNHIAHAYLTQLILPSSIKSAPSRIVIVSAKLHEGPPMNYDAFAKQSSVDQDANRSWNPLRSYQQSKLANILYTRALATLYKQQGITVYSLHPGVITTNLGGNKILASLVTIFYKKKTIEQGAATTIYCTVKPRIEVDSGRYFDNSTVTNLADKWKTDDIDRFYEWTQSVIRKHTAYH